MSLDESKNLETIERQNAKIGTLVIENDTLTQQVSEQMKQL